MVSAVNSVHYANAAGGFDEIQEHQPYQQQQPQHYAALPPQRRSKRSRAEATANFHAVQK